jgi:transcriptional regulator with XRE-family HTH domain
MNIGKALQRIRFEKGMQQQNVAKKAKISQTYLSLLENGGKPNPSQSVMKKLCRIYDVPPIVVAWYGTDESYIKPRLKSLFKDLKPAIDGLVSELVKPNPAHQVRKPVIKK